MSRPDYKGPVSDQVVLIIIGIVIAAWAGLIGWALSQLWVLVELWGK